jgi:hypothetical protein
MEPDKKSNLIEIRCPFERTAKKNGHSYKCDRLLIRVAQGSRGEAWCWSCRKRIAFEVMGNQAADTTWATA